MTSWIQLLKRAVPAIWLAATILFPLESTSGGVLRIDCACTPSAEDTATACPHTNYVALQEMGNACRREGKATAVLAPVKSDPFPRQETIRVQTPSIHWDGEAILISRYWQFSLRTAIPPRAPTFIPLSC
jgi:hypothetical protein